MAASAPIPSSAPSEYFRRHHEVVAPKIDAGSFHPAWRWVARLDKLLAARQISPREWRVAAEYRDTHERAQAGTVRVMALDGTGDGSPNYRRLGPSERQLAALERLAAVRRALGIVADIVDELVINDSSWAGIGKRFGCSAKTAKAWCLAALQELAEAW